ncbi:CoA-binding protein [Actinokineospora sp. UTMC 2448]|uniref:CoA-binding protein n=1 Tax=Actinokineospora sp. UTMC 2448 TaxID=2268449 RepID=UPI0021644D48|nr:CoA-binding protein [Actinokineospora sp. UTMC 2448]
MHSDLTVVERLLHESRTVAVVGLSADPRRPSHGVARYLVSAGLTVYPVNPGITSWEGLPAYATLADVPGPIDIVDVFRRPEHAPEVARDAVAVGAGALWLQLGVISEEAASIAAEGGLDVVMDRCLAVEHREVVGWS